MIAAPRESVTAAMREARPVAAGGGRMNAAPTISSRPSSGNNHARTRTHLT
ncbi:Uncharacterised protein [Mycobacteroides abscessus subsp. abscessus]|nr:Uncharacterised protein [Mycobacteroides abscessus subsp. abscessus]